MLKEYYIICHLWTDIIGCKSCHEIETFELVFSFFSFYHLQVKFMFTYNILLMEKRNTVKMASIKQFMNPYLECINKGNYLQQDNGKVVEARYHWYCEYQEFLGT